MQIWLPIWTSIDKVTKPCEYYFKKLMSGVGLLRCIGYTGMCYCSEYGLQVFLCEVIYYRDKFFWFFNSTYIYTHGDYYSNMPPCTKTEFKHAGHEELRHKSPYL